MSAKNFDGKVVAVGDQVTIMGRVASHTGTGSTASCTVTTILNDSITVPANNQYAFQHETGSLFSIDGKQFGDTNKSNTLGVVTAVGTDAERFTPLTVTILNGTSVSVKSGACRSTSQV